MTNYARCLLELSKELTEDDLKSIRFLLKNDHGFGSGDVDGKDALEILNLLKESGKICQDNNTILVDLLTAIRRIDLKTRFFGIPSNWARPTVADVAGTGTKFVFLLVPTAEPAYSYIVYNRYSAIVE